MLFARKRDGIVLLVAHLIEGPQPHILNTLPIGVMHDIIDGLFDGLQIVGPRQVLWGSVVVEGRRQDRQKI